MVCLRGMKTLVTGGAGFIGTHVVRRLLMEGDDVVVLDSLEAQVHDGRPASLPEGANLFAGSVGDADLVDRALDSVDRVVHLAAAVGVGQSMYEIAGYVARNTMDTALFLDRLVRRSPRPKRLVVASSMSIYGEGEYVCEKHGRVAPAPRSVEQLETRRWECRCPQCGEAVRPQATPESKPLIPTSIYAITKRDHEEMCLVVGGAYDIATVALRFFNVYGPGQALSNPYTGVAAIFASRLLNGRPPIIFEDGLQSRDFVHVHDIVDGIMLALESEEAVGTALNLGTGLPTTVGEVAVALSAGLGVAIEPELTGWYRAGDVRHCFADATRARELLGFRARTKFEDGMTELVAWLARQDATDRVDVATAELFERGLAS
jgi:dTDP-L-rhamnose 4-epimerase